MREVATSIAMCPQCGRTQRVESTATRTVCTGCHHVYDPTRKPTSRLMTRPARKA